jgi:hypothetical protein
VNFKKVGRVSFSVLMNQIAFMICLMKFGKLANIDLASIAMKLAARAIPTPSWKEQIRQFSFIRVQRFITGEPLLPSLKLGSKGKSVSTTAWKSWHQIFHWWMRQVGNPDYLIKTFVLGKSAQ